MDRGTWTGRSILAYWCLGKFYLSQVHSMSFAIFPQCWLGYIGNPQKLSYWTLTIVCLHILDDGKQTNRLVEISND